MEYQPFSARIRLLRIPYYVDSFLKLLWEIEPRFRIKLIQDLVTISSYKTIYLSNKLVFKLKTLLDLLTLKEVVLDDEYQKYGARVENDDKIIVDIGAGFGDFSIMVAKKFPRSKIFAFEPDSMYFSLLNNNLLINNINNVISFKKAINKLSDIFQMIKQPRIDFLKMDCEGFEYQIFDSRSSKKLQFIKKIVLEYHESENKKVNSIIKLFKNGKFYVRVFPRQKVDDMGILVSYRKK